MRTCMLLCIIATGCLAEKITVEQIIIQTIVSQKANLTLPPPHLFGKKLNTFLNCADNETFKKKFAELPLRAKLMYMLTSTIEEYHLFLERYTDDEWEALRHELPLTEQKHLPRTRTEQLTLIRDAYYAYLEENSSFLFAYFNPKAPYPSDVHTFKKQFYADTTLITERNDMSRFENNPKTMFIEAYMFRKRYELFNL